MRTLLVITLILIASAALAAGPVIVADFESPSDLKIISSRKNAQLADDISSRGTNSLRIESGDYINIKTDTLGRGRANDLLKIDFFNAMAVPQSIRVEIFDADTKSYWMRHVREYSLPPGWNTLAFRVARLYRGEKNSQRIKDQFLTPSKINRVDIEFYDTGERGHVFIDNIRFEPDPPMPAVTGLRAFDFGPPNQAARYGLTPCTNEKYSRERGWGWATADGNARDYVHPNDVLGDFRESRGDTFSADVPNGRYEIRVCYEDHGWWEDQFTQFAWRTITAENKLVYEERPTREQAAKEFYRFADFEPMPDTDVYDVYIRNGRYKPKAFAVDVTDGRLDIKFDADRPMACRAAALFIWPAESTEQGELWLAELDARMHAEFDAENIYTAVGPRGRKTPASDDGILIFSTGTKPAPPDYVPEQGELLGEINLFAGAGESTGTSIALRSASGGELRVTPNIPGVEASIFVVQNRIQRHDGGYTIAPGILRPAEHERLDAGITRQLWLEIKIAPDAKPAQLKGDLTLEIAGTTRTVPVTIDILPVKLVEPPMSFGMFGMAGDRFAAGLEPQIIEILAEHGMNSVTGVPLANVRAEGGRLVLDCTAADTIIALLKKHGMRGQIDSYGGGGFRGLEKAASELGISKQDALRQAAEQLKSHAELMGWPPISVSLVDEPHWSDDAVNKVTETVREYKTAAPWILQNGYWSPDASNAAHRSLMDALDRTTMGNIRQNAVEYLKSHGKKLGYYGGTDRYGFGLRQWAAFLEGLDTHYAWHFYIRYGDLYYDLDSREPDVCMIYYTPDSVRASLKLKDVRAGAYDFRYLYTLSALADGKSGPGAERARQLLKQAAATGDIYGKGGAKIDDPDAFRRQVTDAIIELQK